MGSKKSQSLQVGALWIPPGTLQGGRKLPNEGTSPLVCRFLRKPIPKGNPLTLKRSKVPRKPYRIPHLQEVVSNSKTSIAEISLRHKYKQQMLAEDIREERYNRDADLRGVQEMRKNILGAGVAVRQRFTFDIVKQKKGNKSGKAR